MIPPGHRALRKGRVSFPGQAYFTTVVTRGRERRFDDFDTACAVARVLANAAVLAPTELMAWVLMPDHWHGLLRLAEGHSLSACMGRINAAAAQAANRAANRRGPVWQGAFHDHALRSDEALVSAARYLVANPVRAGLVSQIGRYPFWNAVWL
jgi:REP element-mobilizing transposase RayT